MQSLQLLLLCAIMNILRNFSNIGQLIQNTKEAFRSLVDCKEQALPLAEQEEKKNANDATMISENKIQEDSFVSNASSILSQPERQAPQRYELTGLFGNNPSSKFKKRHFRELYYNSQGKQIEAAIAKKRYESEQVELRKRANPFQVETFEQERERLLKKYIKYGHISKERQDSLDEIQAVLVQGSMMRDEEETIQPIYKVIVRDNKVKETVKVNDLPDFGDFQVNYSLEELREMDYKQLSSVPSLTVSNRFGKVQFLEPVNLIKKDLRRFIYITLNDFCLKSELKSKRIKLTLFTPHRNCENIAYMTERMKAMGLQKRRRDAYTGALTFTYHST